MSSSVGMALICACHRFGWPVAAGGSRSITDALAAVPARARRRDRDRSPGALALGAPRRRRRRPGPAPGGVAEIAGDRLPARVARAYRRYRHGPGAFKVDLAVEGGVPGRRSLPQRRHRPRIGSFEEIVAAERDINRGRMPERPFVLVGQQYLADPRRSAGDVHPIWAYAHVPSGYHGDAEGRSSTRSSASRRACASASSPPRPARPREIESANANYVGGDIITGANAPMPGRDPPAPRARPLRHRHPGVFICSAATPPAPAPTA